MSDRIDARGLSCPQPVLITLEKLKSFSPVKWSRCRWLVQSLGSLEIPALRLK